MAVITKMCVVHPLIKTGHNDDILKDRLRWNMEENSVNRSKNINSMSYETLREALNEQADRAE